MTDRVLPEQIRNFGIIAHVDHGKSTLADRILQLTGAVSDRDMREQYLDRLYIERERGITIKSQAVTLQWDCDATQYVLNMVDTPGHVDFTYEVSRSLAACEAAVILVDATQGVEAQTLANLHLAIENNLLIIPVLSKVDLPSADVEGATLELSEVLECRVEDVMHVSGKTGYGVKELLDLIVRKAPPPKGDVTSAPRALIFDSIYDSYRGVVTYVKMCDGTIRVGDKIRMMSTGAEHTLLEVGVSNPEPQSRHSLSVGEVGYFITGVKDVRKSRVGDTITTDTHTATVPLPGYSNPKPMVFSGIYPLNGNEYSALREGLDRLKLSDASIVYTPETSAALGFGFRCGFLGLLHMEIVSERLNREFGLATISTAPSVAYEITPDGEKTLVVMNPSDFPSGKIKEIKEPTVKVSILSPKEYIGSIMELCQARRGVMQGIEYFGSVRAELIYVMPLAEIVFDFFDSLKSRTKGYASFDYNPEGSQPADLVKVDILLQGNKVDAFSAIVHSSKAYSYGSSISKRLSELIPRQQFEVPIQAAIGSRVVARETIRAVRKDVVAKCYGGDITRKRKLLERQKQGKARMKLIGRVEVPQEVFVATLSSYK
ncbi:MAG: translation elongation factor 4 [Tropheryma whipplei]|uniref:Elongation factor 4 n=1 Tax=Tropheryma whipplei (strain TW08/27) TaxID=218496 RepID=LEPA_TROW8|nr:translation elongation factor 4 [Tropheryma whipplei]Q83NI1.1 RecName: Full=Elongation factor 4; Short=EF-4; AltName: Full=Ribosomal back-translocase LepA [Tropheryma whipplei TW08/27]MCO8182638.1 translation elongation factor 4 [Tropheryma whipplei]CAD67161.1 GTP-binding protein LepA [Tropheryma whipplei TW08/27]